MTTFLRVCGRDPLVARDGRPFGEGQGNRMRSSGWLYPSVVAGSFRTVLGKAADREFDPATQQELLDLEVAGVLPFDGKQLYFPVPNDFVLDDKERVFRARPVEPRQDEGADWPAEGLWPVLLDTNEDFKPKPLPSFWPRARYIQWLTGNKVDAQGSDCLGSPMSDLRDHVSLDPTRGAAQEGLLFTTVGIGARAIPRHGHSHGPAKPNGLPRRMGFTDIELAVRVDNLPVWGQQGLSKLPVWHPLGGERRLAHWRTSEDREAWKCPKDVVDNMRTTKRIMLVLATPAIFTDGWKPNWLDTGSPFPGGPRLRLVGVCIQRWRAVSGWSYKIGGPKAIRRMVPAGGVYFFESENEDNSALAIHWLRPVSDREQDRRDGFGLALWGTWQPNREN